MCLLLALVIDYEPELRPLCERRAARSCSARSQFSSALLRIFSSSRGNRFPKTSMRRTVLLEPVLGKVASSSPELPHCRPMRRRIEWLRGWRVEDEISFQGVEYDEKTGKMKLKP